MNPGFRRLATLACCALWFAATGCERQQASLTVPELPKPKTLLIPQQGAYTGAYIDFGEYEDEVTLEAIEAFEKLIGKHQAIIASSSYWGEQRFPLDNLLVISRHGSVPLVFWSPWDRPYQENAGPDKFSLTRIIAGEWDAYIDQWGKAAADFGSPMMVSFANEPNGTWFPWSGVFYGGGNPGSAPGKFVGPETYVKAWRHIVDRVRAQGATNIQWVFHTMNYGYPNEVWNSALNYYPGDDYADWVGCSIYGKQFVDEGWPDFDSLIDWPYEQLTKAIPNKPFMAVEWGIGEFPKAGNKGEFIHDALDQMLRKPKLKAAVFWHERWENSDGTYSNLRVNSSPEALKAYREGVARAGWLDKPQLR